MKTLDANKFSLIENFINDFREDRGVAPTFDEISKGIHIPKTTVARYLSNMRERGMIEYAGKRNIITKETKKMSADTLKVPVLGAVSCGVPKFAEENIEEYVRLPISIFGKGDFYILRANGDSMIEAGINDGDLVLIKQQNTAEPGQIVVALIDDEATLKRFYPETKNKRVRLHPENRNLKDIYVENCIIQGVATKVLKDLEQI